MLGNRTAPGTQDYKQVIVAVKMDKTGNLSSQRGYVEVQSDFIDPTDSKQKTRAQAARAARS